MRSLWVGDDAPSSATEAGLPGPGPRLRAAHELAVARPAGSTRPRRAKWPEGPAASVLTRLGGGTCEGWGEVVGVGLVVWAG